MKIKIDYPADYPTNEELQKIKEWHCEDFHGLFEYIKDYWEKWGSFRRVKDIYILATGGWSGNEDIIDAIIDNQMFYVLYWYSSNRGGRHIFCECNLENIKLLDVPAIKEK